MLNLILGASALLAGPVSADCTREALGQVASKFLNSITTGTPIDATSPLTYTENFKDANVASGVFSKAIKIAHNRTLLDAPACGIYVEIIAPENKPGYHIGTQIFVDAAGKANKVEAVINSDVAGSNSWFYNGKRTLDVITKEEREGGRGVIPEAKRDTRELLKSVAEDYFSIFGGGGAVRKAPKFAPGCTRSEGGFPTSIPCAVGVPGTGSSGAAPKSSAPGGSPPASKGTGKGIRSIIIDETVGSVQAHAYFGGAAPDTHDFRVENGLVRYVHAITVMSLGGAGGGLSGLLSGLGKSGGGGGAPKGALPKGVPKGPAPGAPAPPL